ncbi:hypothetical protein BCR32DRAFT_273774 [Anaeromyces robustus]|uniref:Uncharacterized protein n=1 Tax=Anaeromyces robustus TaxID=1754192 RepID=A0A1Y1XR28_9FUNG|nr:hypothetical protein BCR32DRAFT_273774 [Anaeromyces robustus]|eukprot:ORX88221.1 hypothetical protein BCR32DRAFT_273774 [Anaeromyces robustus]
MTKILVIVAKNNICVQLSNNLLPGNCIGKSDNVFCFSEISHFLINVLLIYNVLTNKCIDGICIFNEENPTEF